jgi:hypothetical protein
MEQLISQRNTSPMAIKQRPPCPLPLLTIKGLRIDQSIINRKIHNSQIHQHKRTCWKKNNQFVDTNIQNHQWNMNKCF